MRHFADKITKEGGDVDYFKLSSKSFFEYLSIIIKKRKISSISVYEIEDKFFEEKFFDFCGDQKIEIQILQSPMFLNSREKFKEYNDSVKKPLMKSFYEAWRRESQVLMEKGSPVGGKFSFDTENRKKIPKSFKVIINKLENTKDPITKDVKKIVDKNFPTHPGDSNNFWLAISRQEVLKRFDTFLKDRFQLFGDYEDALDVRDPFLYHSVLSPYINSGLITPREIIERVEKINIPLNSKEGFIRQIAGWREFMRGIYQEYSEAQINCNYFDNKRRLTEDWYKGTTGIDPLDDAIKKAQELGYCHHIERLMVISNMMLLCEIHPDDVYKWFMEMFVDSSDWVMVPNVYGMAQFSDGGIFATKPYISGSNYINKMGHYKKGEWCDIMDGLYWGFIHKKRDFFKSNYRMSMMVTLLDKMDLERKTRIFSAAKNFLKDKTI
jgi:deoxyribodipyrimidine photolyase-related protein